jgi:hypothetical protein
MVSLLSKHTLTLEPKTDFTRLVGFDILIPVDSLNETLKEIAHSMVGTPLYNGDGRSGKDVIGKIVSAWVEDEKGHITFEAKLSKEGKVLQKAKKGYRPENSLGLKP